MGFFKRSGEGNSYFLIIINLKKEKKTNFFPFKNKVVNLQ